MLLVEGKLNVVDPDDAQAPGDRKGDVANILNFPVHQGLGRGHGDGIAGVNPNRVQVFHHRQVHHRPRTIAHHQDLNFL